MIILNILGEDIPPNIMMIAEEKKILVQNPPGGLFNFCKNKRVWIGMFKIYVP